MTPEVFRKLLVAGTAVAALQRSAVSTERGDREGHGTERPVIAGEGSRDEPSFSSPNEESQTNGS